MDTSTRYGKLYSYLLEVSKEVIYQILHDHMDVPSTSKEMYDHFKSKKILQKILEWEYLSKKQKNILLPDNEEIDLRKLDFTIYYQIYSILDGNYQKGLLEYLRNLRNTLCHLSLVSLRNDFSKVEFEKKWRKTTKDFEYFSVDTDLLERCQKNIRDRI